MSADSGSVFTPGTRVRIRTTGLAGRAGIITEPYVAPGRSYTGHGWLVRLDVHLGNRNVGDVAFAESELEPLS